MKQVIIVKEYNQTCYAYPTQFDVYDTNGIYYYFRYRHGNMSIYQGEELDDLVMRVDFGEENQGVCKLEDFIKECEKQNIIFIFKDAIGKELEEEEYSDEDFEELKLLLEKYQLND